MLPRSIVVPPGGVVAITRPRGTVSENVRSTCGSKPASRSRSSACRRGRPASGGTGASPGPVDTVSSTTEPSGASVSGSGFCAATRSRSTSALATFTTSTRKPRFLTICDAVADRRPTTRGTVSCSGRSSSHRPTAIAASASSASSHAHQRRPGSSSSMTSSTIGGGGRISIGAERADSSAAMNSSASW